jgi:putative membrane protein
MWGTGWGYWGWGWWFWVFWVAIFFVVIWLIAMAGGSSRNVAPEEQILRERYARGEITKEEFDRRIRDLRRAA